jgi:hypothetical protein
MTFISTIQRITKPKPRFLVEPKEPIEEAFVLDGLRYYQFVDPMKTPGKRGLNAVTIFEELRMRIKREHLKEFIKFNIETIKQLEDSLSGKTGRINLNQAFDSIQNLKKTNIFLKERMDFIFEPELAYKFASVVFFDENENPYDYDAVYCAQKIERWKKAEDMEAFFLRQPIARLIPYTESSEIDLKTYSKIVNQIIGKQMSNISTSRSN